MDRPPSAEPSVAEVLPDSYRRVLDRVADLETAGHRLEADLVRRDAIAAYSRRWNERTAQRLVRLALRAERVLDGHDRPRRRVRSGRADAVRWLAMGPTRLRRRIADAAGGHAGRPRPGDMRPERPTV